jgi:hypothetical protein
MTVRKAAQTGGKTDAIEAHSRAPRQRWFAIPFFAHELHDFFSW